MRFFTAAVAAVAAFAQVGDAFGRKMKRDTDPSLLYPAHNISLPVDHFHNESMYAPHSNAMFNNRYWFDDTYYKPGGPVFLLIVGEINGDDRLPILQKGIIYQLNKLYGGLGVVMEHRYFGRSQPQPDLSTENYRFLTTDQALADTAYFAQHIVFPGHEHENLTASATPWITYGGSYAGAFVAFLRTQYPGVFWGSISSSGVTEAIWDYWQYFVPIMQYADQTCISNLQKLTNMMDNIITGNRTGSTSSPMGNPAMIQDLKNFFGLGGIKYDNDFMYALATPTGYWQELEFDPAINSTVFGQFCGNMSSSKPLYPTNASQTAEAKKLLTEGGYEKEINELTTPLLNYVGFSNTLLVEPCAQEGETQEQCFTTHNKTYYEQTDYDAWAIKSWPYMYCTQWGFLQTGSGFPKDQLPIISRLVDLPYSSIICNDAFNITAPPDTKAITDKGGFNISYDRLAIIGGKLDPWRPSTPMADGYYEKRQNTTQQPALLISDGVHHWDEYGVFPNETTPNVPPEPVAETQSQEHAFVKAWLDEAKGKFPATGGHQ